jgi:beta-glucosidase-like glycosyl hydrolase
VILFKKNCESEAQVKKLTTQLKRYGCLVVIDIEGQIVNRLSRFFPLSKNQRDFEFSDSKDAYSYFAMIARYAKNLGVDVILTPVTDVSEASNSAAWIGQRSFSNDPDNVARLAFEAVTAIQDNGITPVIKHLPGHGKAKVDSHKVLPSVTEAINADIAANRKLVERLRANGRKIPPCIVAHVAYQSYGENLPATLSQRMISVVRKDIGIEDGVILSDCIRMGALQNFSNVADMSHIAGVDIVICGMPIEEIVATHAAMLKKRYVTTEKYKLLSPG